MSTQVKINYILSLRKNVRELPGGNIHLPGTGAGQGAVDQCQGGLWPGGGHLGPGLHHRLHGAQVSHDDHDEGDDDDGQGRGHVLLAMGGHAVDRTDQ